MSSFPSSRRADHAARPSQPGAGQANAAASGRRPNGGPHAPALPPLGIGQPEAAEEGLLLLPLEAAGPEQNPPPYAERGSQVGDPVPALLAQLGLSYRNRAAPGGEQPPPYADVPPPAYEPDAAPQDEPQAQPHPAAAIADAVDEPQPPPGADGSPAALAAPLRRPMPAARPQLSAALVEIRQAIAQKRGARDTLGDELWTADRALNQITRAQGRAQRWQHLEVRQAQYWRNGVESEIRTLRRKVFGSLRNSGSLTALNETLSLLNQFIDLHGRAAAAAEDYERLVRQEAALVQQMEAPQHS